jgi:hypothetical protein
MNIKNIYQDTVLKYPLTNEEYINVDDAWEFLEIFKKKFIFLSDYRDDIIKKIRNKYTVDEFYLYEKILNKLFWNLRWLMFPLWENENISKNDYHNLINNNYNNIKKIPNSLLLCKFESYKNNDDMENKVKYNKLFEDTYYRSFINKLLIVDKKNKQIITKPIEGSSDIFTKNYFNLLSITILFDKDLYETIIKNPYKLKNMKIPLSKYYYEYDYGFPNLNYCIYKFGTKENRTERIKKMYFSKKPEAMYWFRIIR